MSGRGARLSGSVGRALARWVGGGVVAAGAVVVCAAPVVAAPAGNGEVTYTAIFDEKPSYAVRMIGGDGDDDRQLFGPTDRFGTGATNAVWSKDGERVLFVRLRGGAGGGLAKARDLWIADAGGHHLRRVPLGLGLTGLWGFDFSPSGKRIVFSAGRVAAYTFPGSRGRPMIYTIRVDGTHRRALRRGWSPTWAPHGGHIAFTRESHPGIEPGTDRFRIGVMRSDGSDFRLLHPDLNDAAPAFSPDGRRIAYVRNFASLQEAWGIVDVDGSNDTVVRSFAWVDYSTPTYCPPQWSADGQRLASVRTLRGPTGNDPEIGQFITTDLAGGDERVVFTFPRLIPNPSRCDFSWRPLPR